MAPRIGVIDSGAGAITVLVPLMGRMPWGRYIYFADRAWCPYGPRPVGEVRARVMRIVESLVGDGCVLVVVACNTATAAAIEHLRATFPIPFVGMEPAIKPAALSSRTGAIGVLATEGTFQGALFRRGVARYKGRVHIHTAAGRGLVELVEGNRHRTPEASEALRAILEPMQGANIDRLVLGCTHYPFFSPLLRTLLPAGVKIVNPAPAVAIQAERLYPRSEENSNGAGSLEIRSSGGAGPLLGLLESYAQQEGVPLPTRVDVLEGQLG